MSTPTFGSDPNYPPPAPQGQPDWGAPQPPGYGSPAPTYGNAPSGFGGAAAAGRPPQVLAAAILGFVAALFSLWIALAFLAFSTLGLFAGIAVIFGIVFLVIAGLNVWGGIVAIQGKNSVVLMVAGAITAVFGLLAMFGDFSALDVLVLLVGGATVGLLLTPQSKQYFAARGAR